MQQRHPFANHEEKNLKFFESMKKPAIDFSVSLLLNLSGYLTLLCCIPIVTAQTPNNPYNFAHNGTFYTFKTNPTNLGPGLILSAFYSIIEKLVEGALGNITESLGSAQSRTVWSGPRNCGNFLELLSNGSTALTSTFGNMLGELVNNDTASAALDKSCKETMNYVMILYGLAIFSAVCCVAGFAYFSSTRGQSCNQRQNYNTL